MKLKKIALMLALSLSINIVGAQMASASEIDVTSSNSIEISEYAEFLESGVFNPDEMTDDQREAYNAAIDKQVEIVKAKYGKKLNAAKFRKELVTLLETKDSLKNIQYTLGTNSSLRVAAGTWVPDICISNEYVSAAIGILINGALIASGVGSVTALVKKIGAEEAKKIFTKSLKSKLIAWGCGSLAYAIPKLVDFIISVTSPEDKIAEYLDSIDSYPNDGYLDIIL